MQSNADTSGRSKVHGQVTDEGMAEIDEDIDVTDEIVGWNKNDVRNRADGLIDRRPRSSARGVIPLLQKSNIFANKIRDFM